MFKKYILLFCVGIIWGSQFIFQDLALNSLSPVWLGASRSLIGMLTLCIICYFMGLKAKYSKWGIYSLIGLLEAAIPFTLIPWGQQYLDSSTTAILMGTIPIYTVLLTPFFNSGTKISLNSLASVIIGFTGVVILFYPEFTYNTVDINLIATAAILVSSASFATALLLLSRCGQEHPLIVSRNVLTAASIQILIIAFISSPQINLNIISSSLGAIIYLGIMCGGIVYFLYMALIRESGPVFASMINYIVPAFGVVIGVTINHESFSANKWFAPIIILFGVAINQVFESHGTCENKSRIK